MIIARLLILIFVFSNSLLAVHTTHASSACAEFLNSVREGASSSEADETKGFMGYLGMLLDRQVIGNTELHRLIKGLERGELLNPISEKEAETDIASQVQREGIQEHIDQKKINHEELLKFARESLEEKKRVKEKRTENRKETWDADQKMEFHLVPAGSFWMGGKGKKKKKVHLTYPTEVMSTQVTQRQWAELMGENPSYFEDGDESIVVEIGGKSIRMQPNHPVESITWWSVLVFLNRLSERDGLRPAYDLSKMKWEQWTRAEDGTLNAERGKIKINAKNYYQLEGYRLPTADEQEYLLRAAGKANGRYYFGEDAAELKDHAWYDENSEGKTHAVGELKSLIIDGKEFSDVLGNVWEWGWSSYEGDSFYRVMCGGSCWNKDKDAYNTSLLLRSSSRSAKRIGNLGLRAMRTTHPRAPLGVFTFSRLKSFLGKMGLRKSK